MYLHFSNFVLVFMIVGLVGEAVVIAEDFRPLIPPLFLSPDNTMQHMSIYDCNVLLIHLWNAAGALVSPKGITKYSYVPYFVVKVVFHSSPSLILML